MTDDEALDIEVAAAEWTLGRLERGDLQALARTLLGRGFSGPSLLELAGTPSFVLGRDLTSTVEAAFRECGTRVPTREEAALGLTRDVARAILAGRIEPFEGAQRIWTLAYDIGDRHANEVSIFVACASQIEDFPDSRREMESTIRAEAARLLEAHAEC